MPFAAKWPGDCVNCDEGIQPNERVEFNDDRELQHVHCPKDTTVGGQPRPVCPRCFLVMVRDETTSGWRCGYCED